MQILVNEFQVLLKKKDIDIINKYLKEILYKLDFFITKILFKLKKEQNSMKTIPK